MKRFMSKLFHLARRDYEKKPLLFVAFSLTFFILIIAFIACRLAPFGSRGLMSMDAFSQYFPMLRAMRDALHSGSGFEYSFQGAGGFNLWVQSAYYTNSPLWLPVYFVPYSWMPATVHFLVALRISLASMFFCLWLTRDVGRAKPSAVIFALCYGLCGWALAFMNQFMWADAYMLLPLVALGIDRIFKGRKPILYTLALGITLWSNFYIGYMVCIFSLLWFLVCLAGEKRGHLLKHTANFALGSLLAAGMAAAVLIPTYLGLKQTIASSLTFNGEIRLYHSLWEMLERLLPMGKTSLEFQAPNMYCGLLCVPLALLPIADRRIPLGKKIAFGALTGFIFLSFNLNLLDFIWHGFHYPNQLPGRQSFLFSFLLVSAAYKGWTLLGSREFAAEFTGEMKTLRRITCCLVALLLATEVAANAFYTVGTQVWKNDLDKYTASDADMKAAVKKYNSGYRDFWRCEFLTPGNNNAGQMYSFKGISYYSSTMTQNAYEFFQSVGQPIYALNVSTKFESDRILNSFYGIRYLFDRGEYPSQVKEEHLEGLTLIDQIGNVRVYENRDWLSLGFWVENSADVFDFSEGFQATVEKLKTAQLKIKSFSSTLITGSIDCPRDGMLFLTIPQDAGWHAVVDGVETPIKNVAGYFSGIDLPQGSHTVKLCYSTPGLSFGTIISLISVILFVLMVTKGKKSTHKKTQPKI